MFLESRNTFVKQGVATFLGQTFLGQNIFSEDVLSAVLRHADMEMKNLTCNGLF